VFLAAIMVISMVALSASFAGAAGAQQVTTQDRTVPSEAAPGETVTVTVDASLDSASSVNFADAFSPDVADAAVTDAGGASFSGANTGEVFANWGSTDTVSLTYTVTIPSDAQDGDTFEISDSSSSDLNLGTDTITVATDGNGQDPGDGDDEGPAASYSLNELDTNEPIIWQGQSLEITGITSDTLQVWESNEAGDRAGHVGDESVSGSSVTIDTTDLEAGNWYVVRSGGTNYGPFFVTEQDVSFEFAAGSIAADGSTTLDFANDNRGEAVDLIVSADNLDADDLASILEGASVESSEDGTVRVQDVSEGDSVNADFTGVAAGDYNFTVEVADTTASDSASIEVTDINLDDANFDQGVYSEEVGDVAGMGVETAGLNNVYVEMEDEHGVLDHTFQISGVGDSAGFSLNTWNTLPDVQDSLSTSTEDASLSEVSADSDDISEQLQPSRVNLRLYTGNPADGGTQLDRSILRLEDNSLGAATTWTAPASADVGGADIADLVDASTQRSNVAAGDYLVTQVEASGVFGYLAGDGEFDPWGQGLSMTWTDTNEPAYGSADSLALGDDLAVGEDVWLRQDPGSNQFFAIVSPAAVDEIGADETWNVEFGMSSANPYVDADGGISASAEFTHVARSISFDVPENDDGQLVVRPEDGVSISGSSSAAPGTEVDLTAFFDTEIRDASATVGADGTWSTSLDLGSYDAGAAFTAEAAESGQPASGVDPVTTGEVSFVTGEPPTDPGAEAEFEVSARAPTNVAFNGNAAVSYSFTNTGGQSGTVEYQVLVDGEVVDEGTADLDGGASTAAMSYSLDTGESGNIDWDVETQDDSESGTVYVREQPAEPEPASFQLFASAPSQVTQGQDAQIQFSITNTGGSAGEVEYTVDSGDNSETYTATLAPGASTDTLTWDLPTNEAGEVNWEVTAGDQSRTGTLTVEAPPEPPADDEDGDDGDDGDGGQPGFGLIVALFALIGAALLALRRQD